MKDLFLYSHVTDLQAWYVAENQVCKSNKTCDQGYHNTGNLVISVSGQGKHREFKYNTGEKWIILGLSSGLS